MSSWVAEVLQGGVVADSVRVVTSLTLFFAFAFLALVVGSTALVRFLEQVIVGHVTNTSAHEATRLLSIGFAPFPLALVAFAFLRHGIDIHVV